MEQIKLERANEEQRNREMGNPGDVDFQRMIRLYRQSKEAPVEQGHVRNMDNKICICVRKRPISSKEVKKMDYDSVTCLNPVVIVHDCKLKVDGISKYLDNASFEFDHTFHEEDTTEDIYHYSVQPLVDFVVNAGGARATVFAYGQTGSGKTFTMQGIQNYVAEDLFALLAQYATKHGKEVQVLVSYFEIYGGRCQDLLNSRERLNVREDGNGEVVVSDLMEIQADSIQTLHAIIETGNRNRTTHATESNDVSSRSHAICQIALRCEGSSELVGRLSLIDLAGSERGADTKSHNRQRRMEGAEINKSLLALKECVRALDSNSSHVPYRASKLTLVLKDSFTNKRSRTVMIAAVSPAASSADHTINTLRYADRIKERVVGGQAAKNAAALAANNPNPNPRKVDSNGSPPNSALNNNNKDRNVRNREIQKVLADHITEGNPNPNRSSAQQAQPKYPPTSQTDQKGHKGPAAQGNGHKASNHNNGRAMLAHQEEEEDTYSGSGEGSGAGEGFEEEEDTDLVDRFHQTVQDLFAEEEDLLNMHMSVIQENAELLTEEGRLLQQIQGENNDIDAYASRLDAILQRKQELISLLRDKLDHFRKSLIREEKQSRRAAGRMTAY